MSTFSNNSARADVSDPNDLPTLVATWPEEWQDSFAEREAIMTIDASHPYVPAIREAFKDTQNLQTRFRIVSMTASGAM